MCRKTALTLLFNGIPIFEGYKSSVLITVATNNIEEIMCNENKQIFREKGLELKTMGECLSSTRILIFNRKALEEDVYSKERFEFLQTYGYSVMPLDEMLNKLTTRLNNCNVPCPYEIGVFLGYPLEDIKGFMQNKTFDYSINNYWKVYSNKQKTHIVFDNYRKNRQINLNKITNTIPISEDNRREKIV